MLKNCLIIIFMLLTTAITGIFIKDNFYKDMSAKECEENLIKQDIDNNESIDNENIEISDKNPEVENSITNPNTNNEVNNVIENDNPIIPEEDNSLDIEQDNNEEEKKCTPLKFDFSFARADFSSFEECTSMGDKYLNMGYGYICDYFPDDCGVVYYMLTIYEANTGKMYNYHDIPLED